MTTTTTPTSGAADLLTLIEAYAEARHRQGHSSYNAQTSAALQAVKDALAAGQATAAQQEAAYAALPDEVVRLAQVAIRECQYKGNDMPQDWMESAMRACRLIAASHGRAPAGAAEELALTRQTNLAVVQRLQAKINALEAELDASRKAESQVQSYADDLDRRAQYDADNLADACGGYGGERI